MSISPSPDARYLRGFFKRNPSAPRRTVWFQRPWPLLILGFILEASPFWKDYEFDKLMFPAAQQGYEVSLSDTKFIQTCIHHSDTNTRSRNHERYLRQTVRYPRLTFLHLFPDYMLQRGGTFLRK